MNVRLASLGRVWYSSALAGLALLGTVSAYADGPLPRYKDREPSTIPKVAAPVAAKNLYRDPRKRFNIRHTDDWKLILNWAGMPQPFCQFQPCRSTALATCDFSFLKDKGLTGLDPAMLALAFPKIKDSVDIGILGKMKSADNGSFHRQLGSLEWQRFQFELDLLHLKPFDVSMWFGVKDDNFALLHCQAPKGTVPNLVEKAEEMLAGLEITKP